VSGASDLCKGAMAAAPGRWSLGARAKRLHGYHRHGLAGSSWGAAIAASHRLVLAAIVVVQWCRNLDVIFIMLEMLYTSGELL
jgi:hypothetical protein